MERAKIVTMKNCTPGKHNAHNATVACMRASTQVSPASAIGSVIKDVELEAR